MLIIVKFSHFPARLVCPARKAVTAGRLKRGAGASVQGRAAPIAPPGPCEAASKSESATPAPNTDRARRDGLRGGARNRGGAGERGGGSTGRHTSVPRYDYAAPLFCKPSRRSASRTAPAGRRGPGRPGHDLRRSREPKSGAARSAPAVARESPTRCRSESDPESLTLAICNSVTLI